MKGGRAILIGPRLSGWKEFALQISQVGGTRPNDTFIAVDGGLDSCRRMRIQPEFAIGDWDSLGSRGSLKKVRHVTLPITKDRSDLYFALVAAVGGGFRELLAVGFSGGREDHALGVKYDLMRIASGADGTVDQVTQVSEGSTAHYISAASENFRARLPLRTKVSVFALGGMARGVKLRGFHYDLPGGVLDCSTRGLSNETRSSQVGVSLKSGSLLIVVNHDKTKRK